MQRGAFFMELLNYLLLAYAVFITVLAYLERRFHDGRVDDLLDRYMSKDLTEYKYYTPDNDSPEIAEDIDDGIRGLDDAEVQEALRKEIENG